MALSRSLALVVVLLVGLPSLAAVDKAAIDRAVEGGVTALRQMQGGDGTWPHQEIGATALAGLTLLECGVPAEDRAVRQAADAVRSAGITTVATYSIALSLLFLDRLGDPDDVPLIESLTVRLLAGQNGSGGWSYICPDIGAAEVRRLTTALRQRKELVGRRALPELPAAKRRTVQDLAPEIQQQLKLINRLGPRPAGPGDSDNSNTQFATLALWVGRRHGLPVDAAVARVVTRFRGSQHGDGGWGYKAGASPGHHGHLAGSTATMTCAGLLGLAVGHGVSIERAQEKDRKVQGERAVGADRNLQLGLLALASAITPPPANRAPVVPLAGRGGRRDLAGGRTFYFLWSLERVAVALGLDAISGKDWYGWGSAVALASQQPDGSWQGAYGRSGADTCFALLFLRRANLARDLTAHLQGKVKAIDATLKAQLSGPLKPALEPPDADTPPSNEPAEKSSRQEAKPALPEPVKPPVERREPPLIKVEAESVRKARELVQARPEEQSRALERLREGKGLAYTEALVAAIPQLDGERKRQAREALAERLTRMKAETLGNYLKDPEAEIRRAAALAAAMKDDKSQIANLIPLLNDPVATVVRAAHLALKELTGQTFGPDRVAWRTWWDNKK